MFRNTSVIIIICVRKTIPFQTAEYRLRKGKHSVKFPYIPQTVILREMYGIYKIHVGRDSSVGIATRYGLDGTGIEFR